jgi:hypothetical protein
VSQLHFDYTVCSYSVFTLSMRLLKLHVHILSVQGVYTNNTMHSHWTCLLSISCFTLISYSFYPHHACLWTLSLPIPDVHLEHAIYLYNGFTLHTKSSHAMSSLWTQLLSIPHICSFLPLSLSISCVPILTHLLSNSCAYPLFMFTFHHTIYPYPRLILSTQHIPTIGLLGTLSYP